MAAIEVQGTEVVVTLQTSEKAWGFLSDLRVPLSAVSAVEVVPDGRKATTGMRAPGLGGPKRLIGTWRAKNNRQYVCVARDQPAVKLTLTGQRFNTVLIGLDDAAAVAASIEAARNS